MSMLRVSRRSNSKVSRMTLVALELSERENSSCDPMTRMVFAFLVRAVKTSVPDLL